jgi:hypothetical protein
MHVDSDGDLDLVVVNSVAYAYASWRHHQGSLLLTTQSHRLIHPASMILS